MADFRPCLTCKSYSQASLYHYALQLVSVQPELTFAHFRYTLGSDRPSQTTHVTLSLKKVRNTIEKGWYFKVVIFYEKTTPTYAIQLLFRIHVTLQ